MIEIDRKDKKILYHLLINSRQSYKTIGKKVGASKELVAYRIKRMIENNIIQDFSIILNLERFGYALIQTHYKFITVNPTIKEEIIQFLVESNHTMYVSLIEGIYDLQVEFFLGKPQEFERLLDTIREKYHSYLSFKLSKIPIRGEFYDYTFLLGKSAEKKLLINWIWGQPLYPMDTLDYNILSSLSQNCRIPLKTLANDLHSTVSTINNRMKKLEKEHIIARYKVDIDWSKLGYRWFHLQISLKDYTKKNQIISFMRNNPYLIRRFKFLDLEMDLHFTLLLKNMEELRAIMEEISQRFPDSINDYHFYSTFKIYKYNFLVPSLLTDKTPLSRAHLS